MDTFPFVYDDGGREFAGYKGMADDCTCRAIAIATGEDYETVYQELWRRVRESKGYKNAKAKGKRPAASPRTGVPREIYEPYLAELGWEWFPQTTIGAGTKVHVRPDELPNEDCILRLSKHMTTIHDGELHDTYDCSREGTRAVYGFFTHELGAYARLRADRERPAC